MRAHKRPSATGLAMLAIPLTEINVSAARSTLDALDPAPANANAALFKKFLLLVEEALSCDAPRPSLVVICLPCDVRLNCWCTAAMMA